MNQIGKIHINGKITEYPIPTNPLPDSITVDLMELWFTEEEGDQIGKISPLPTHYRIAVLSAYSDPCTSLLDLMVIFVHRARGE